MDENEVAILEWVNTFDLSQKCNTLSELSDGNIVLEILHEISPSHFDLDVLSKRSAPANINTSVDNLQKLLRTLDEYFRNILHKRIDVFNIDVIAIAQSNDPDEIMNLLELVVGVAVMCEEKAVFIRKIFSLDHLSQTVLKGLVEQVMSRALDLNEEGVDRGLDEGSEGYEEMVMQDSRHELEAALAAANGGTEEDLVRANEMINYLKAERQRLLNDVRQLEQSNTVLTHKMNRWKESSVQNEVEKEVLVGNDRTRSNVAEQKSAQLEADLAVTRRELDAKLEEVRWLRSELKNALQRLEASKEMQAKLEMENHQQADELDVTRDKVGQLAKAEQTIEKYQRKLEEMNTLRKQNKEFSDKMDQYFDQIQDLESQLKDAATNNQMMEKYKNEQLKLQLEQYETLSALKTKESEVVQLSKELELYIESKNKLEDDLQAVRIQLSQVLEAQKQEDMDQRLQAAGINDSADEVYHMESVSSLKEKVRRLERELKLKNDTNSASASSGGSETSPLLHQIALLESELEDVRKIKKDREESLLSMKMQLQEVQYELTKANRARDEAERHSSSASALKEATQKLSETSNTVRLLEDKLKEKENAINKLEQEKGKLESYAQRSLKSFRDKYMDVLEKMTEEKKSLESRLQLHIDKSIKNQDVWHREERLISSAMFEIGVRMMDRKIQSHVAGPDSTPLTQAMENATRMGAHRSELSASPLDASKYPVGPANIAGRRLFSPNVS